ncbi:response regulator transcription factor [Rubrobacter radiotolerans]|uniref:LuxR C-terminal-related transcriptional regulator n=1 Tax=Rubrobacter radiotolerans TaxID=42256 RepID=A0AB35T8G7_RUBRA|nr:LuxR C-terminal-related transcriptional regulator [Rubrobacter radiotolerans]MDX5895190.1 LuxR C-terminal-related transcriptional regulator [Rubrobacter radiotolerans]SMC07621.1 regulatory protein, luxR family [Rubrobacter radiotolerans DSM 5868]
MRKNHEQASAGNASQTISAYGIGRVLLLEHGTSADPRQSRTATAGATVSGQRVILEILLCPGLSGNGDRKQSPDTELYSNLLRNALIRLLGGSNEISDTSREIDAIATSRTPLITPLTDQQLAVLQLLEEGLPAKNMAVRLRISIHTVNYHKRNLYRNLNVSSATEAIRKARDSGLI